MDLGISGRTALVVGSTAGLGLATARALAAEGVRVAVNGRTEATAREIAAALPGAVAVPLDMGFSGAADQLVAQAEAALGPVDILVLNSGGPPPGTADAMTVEQAQAAVDRLLLPQVRLVALTLPGMRSRGWGRVLAIGSSGVQAPLPGLAASNVGRAALAGYLKTLAAEVAADGVTVNMVLPGRVDTDRVAQLDAGRAEREGVDAAEVRARSERAIPAGRYGDTAEFGAVLAFLAGRQASYVTGEQIRCDGGMVASY
jgi:3-oxoacyl-[acyl-carrier protein] reductase